METVIYGDEKRGGWPPGKIQFEPERQFQGEIFIFNHSTRAFLKSTRSQMTQQSFLEKKTYDEFVEFQNPYSLECTMPAVEGSSPWQPPFPGLRAV